MKRSNRLMLLVGVLLAVVAFGGVMMFGSKSGTSGPAAPQTVSVVTALQDVALGSTLTPEVLTTIDLPTGDAIDTFRDPAQLQGLVVRRTVRAGTSFTSADFQSGSVSAIDVTSGLKAGQRAMAIPVNSLSGVGSLIQAGDYVDVMLAITDQPDPNKAPVVGEFRDESGLPATKILDEWLNNTTVKVLVQNVQVLGTLLPAAGTDSTQTDPNTGQPTTGGSIAILSVTPDQAEMVRFAQLDGNLYLLLRAPDDVDAPDVQTTGITLRELVDQHGVLPPRVIITKLP
ncbi:MAG: Flp pilus assembly protein CpaB [Chloroflexi bacterium]|nr:Flp pilus assembly protein CpaB [Chloroflexota bacterium]